MVPSHFQKVLMISVLRRDSYHQHSTCSTCSTLVSARTTTWHNSVPFYLYRRQNVSTVIWLQPSYEKNGTYNMQKINVSGHLGVMLEIFVCIALHKAITLPATICRVIGYSWYSANCYSFNWINCSITWPASPIYPWTTKIWIVSQTFLIIRRSW